MEIVDGNCAQSEQSMAGSSRCWRGSGIHILLGSSVDAYDDHYSRHSTTASPILHTYHSISKCFTRGLHTSSIHRRLSIFLTLLSDNHTSQQKPLAQPHPRAVSIQKRVLQRTPNVWGRMSLPPTHNESRVKPHSNAVAVVHIRVSSIAVTEQSANS